MCHFDNHYLTKTGRHSGATLAAQVSMDIELGVGKLTGLAALDAAGPSGRRKGTKGDSAATCLAMDIAELTCQRVAHTDCCKTFGKTTCTCGVAS